MNTVENLIQACDNLPTLPDIYLNVKRVVEDPKASMVDLAKVLAVDVAMTARVLKLVNSPFYGLGQKVETVSRAASILGMQPIHDLVLATSVATSFSKLSQAVMNMRTFWRNSVSCGLLAREIAKECQLRDSERLFVEGLLSDIGHLVIYEKLPELSAEVLKQAKVQETIRIELEKERIGFSASEVGARLLKEWGLPVNFQDAIQYHMEPTKLEKQTLETSIVHIAGIVTECVLFEIPQEDWPNFISVDAWELTGLSQETLVPILERVNQELITILEMIYPISAAA